MTPQEFKAWFDGFTEALTGTPTKAQWARIKDRVGEIDGKATTERVYIDRYWPIYNQLQPSWRYYSSAAAVGTTSAVGLAAQGTNYNALSAMNSLGRNEAQAISA